MTNGRKALIGILGLTAVLALLLFEWGPVWELRLADAADATLVVIELPEGRFDHVFVHSVHRTPVEERFRIEGADARLHLYELRYQNQGVGMPADAEGGYRLEGGTFVLAMDRSFDRIPVMVSPLEGHGIVADGVLFPFARYQPAGRLITLSARMSRHIRLRRYHRHE